MLKNWVLKGVLLGLVQGMTEFFPISSSGHTVILGGYLGLEEDLFSLSLSLHLGTLLAVFFFFWREIRKIALSMFKGGKWLEDPGRRLLLLIILGSIPGLIMGLSLRQSVAELFNKSQLVAGLLILNGGILFAAEIFSPAKGRGRIEMYDAFIIGLAQGIAILPGISRSGITIATGMLRGISKEMATTYSFLLSIPAVSGAAFIESIEQMDSFQLNITWIHLLGGITAFVSGWLTLVTLFWFIKKRRLKFFALYCLLMGASILIVGN